MPPLDLANDAVGAVLGTVLSAAVTWMGNRVRKPSPAVVERKIEALITISLPQSVPAASREKTINDLTQIAIPTLAEITRYSQPTLGNSDSVRSTGKKSAPREPTSGFRPAGSSTPPRPRGEASGYGSYRSTVKKSAAKKTAAKSTARKMDTKKTAATKTAAKKIATKTPRRASFR